MRTRSQSIDKHLEQYLSQRRKWLIGKIKQQPTTTVKVKKYQARLSEVQKLFGEIRKFKQRQP